jgi:hypothetical protein
MPGRKILFLWQHFMRDVGPNGVRPRASAAAPTSLVAAPPRCATRRVRKGLEGGLR